MYWICGEIGLGVGSLVVGLEEASRIEGASEIVGSLVEMIGASSVGFEVVGSFVDGSEVVGSRVVGSEVVG